MEDEVKTAAGGEAAVSAAADVPAVPAAGASANKPIPKNLTAMKLLSVTKSFVVVRALVYAVVSAIMVGVCLVVLGLCYVIARWGGSAGSLIALIIVLGSLGAIFGFLKFAQRYCLYMIKAAHVAAITEYLRTGEVPVTDKGYQGVLKYGKEMVGKHFGAANIAFVADALISKATRQIMRWVNRAENLLSFIPGAQNVFKIVNFILSTALNFIDEAVLSYIFYHKEEKSSFKKACDGLVYYAQAWKGMLMGAAKTAAFVWILRGACFLIVYGIIVGAGMFISHDSGNFAKVVYIVGVLFALVATYSLQTIIIEPYATCMMIKDYHIAIAGKPLKADLYGTLCKASDSFKKLFDKSKEPVPEISGQSGASEPAAEPAAVTSQV